MNILQVIPELNTGGAERTTIEVADAVMRAGGKAIVFSNGGIMEDELSSIGAKLYKANAKSKNPFNVIIFNVLKLIKIIKSEKIEIIHARSRAPAISALIAARICKIPFVTTYHGIYKAKGKLKNFYNGIMTKGDLVIANSNYTKTYLMHKHNPKPEKIRVIYRGVDFNRFNPSRFTAEEINNMRDLWQINNDLPVILLPARLTEWKGQKLLIKAASILKARGLRANYIFAGDDQGRIHYTESLRELIASYGLTSNFFLIGHTRNMPLVMMCADIIINPSKEPEAFGRTAAEASAMGKPVIATRLGGAIETIEDGVTGFLFTNNNFEELAEKIETLLRMPRENFEEIGKNGEKRVKKLFSTESLQEKTLQLYNELLNRK